MPTGLRALDPAPDYGAAPLLPARRRGRILRRLAAHRDMTRTAARL
jgi:hypothetical protein